MRLLGGFGRSKQRVLAATCCGLMACIYAETALAEDPPDGPPTAPAGRGQDPVRLSETLRESPLPSELRELRAEAFRLREDIPELEIQLVQLRHLVKRFSQLALPNGQDLKNKEAELNSARERLLKIEKKIDRILKGDPPPAEEVSPPKGVKTQPTKAVHSAELPDRSKPPTFQPPRATSRAAVTDVEANGPVTQRSPGVPPPSGAVGGVVATLESVGSKGAFAFFAFGLAIDTYHAIREDPVPTVPADQDWSTKIKLNTEHGWDFVDELHENGRRIPNPDEITDDLSDDAKAFLAAIEERKTLRKAEHQSGGVGAGDVFDAALTVVTLTFLPAYLGNDPRHTVDDIPEVTNPSPDSKLGTNLDVNTDLTDSDPGSTEAESDLDQHPEEGPGLAEGGVTGNENGAGYSATAVDGTEGGKSELSSTAGANDNANKDGDQYTVNTGEGSTKNSGSGQESEHSTEVDVVTGADAGSSSVDSDGDGTKDMSQTDQTAPSARDNCSGPGCSGGGMPNPDDNNDGGGCDACAGFRNISAALSFQSNEGLLSRAGQILSVYAEGSQNSGVLDLLAAWSKRRAEGSLKNPNGRALLAHLKALLSTTLDSSTTLYGGSGLGLAGLLTGWNTEGIGDTSSSLANRTGSLARKDGGNGYSRHTPTSKGDRTRSEGAGNLRAAIHRATADIRTANTATDTGHPAVNVTERRLVAAQTPVSVTAQTEKAATPQTYVTVGKNGPMAQTESPLTKLSSPSTTTSQDQNPSSKLAYNE